MIKKVIIINGDPKKSSLFSNYLTEIQCLLNKKDFEVTLVNLSEKNIKQCIGCWDCWWKTPGLCRFNDDAPEILKQTIQSDLVIYASPLIMGMYSALLKKLHDRTIPLVHPYIEIIEGECHHRKRYPRYPKMGILLDKRNETPEAIEINREIFQRISLNFHSEVKFFNLINEKDAKTTADEISHL
jgi:multimeric flavodoxin WrbA